MDRTVSKNIPCLVLSILKSIDQYLELTRVFMPLAEQKGSLGGAREYEIEKA